MEALGDLLETILSTRNAPAGPDVCPVCGKPKRAMHLIDGHEIWLPVMCDCQLKIEAERKRSEQLTKIDTARSVCFSGRFSKFKSCTFDSDQEYTPEASAKCRAYAVRFADALSGAQQGTGLMLWGGTGTGKSFLAACVANALIDAGYRCLFLTASEIEARMSVSFDAKADVIQEIRKASLLVLDDFGAERRTEYMDQIVYTVINARYTDRMPVIITTNLGPRDFANESDIARTRIYDRILETCIPVRMDGDSVRRAKYRDKMQGWEDWLNGSE